MSTEQLILLVAGAALSWFFEWFPWVHTWFEKQTNGGKRLVMLVTLALSTAGVYGLSCTGYIAAVACQGDVGRIVFEAIGMFVLASIANQGTHRLTKRPESSGTSFPAGKP